ncbi:N-acetyltransferase HPA3 [Roseibium sp. TrichSKD4]|uniref:GNAT family N-acetyltransferase n=1 Tax=Roseibium sp. TrichSKD4 TaxID=744980 RepID=UPI0001E57461|nr:GNAT family N-acetyltransferase [Roseibium sp. TrichSKD4]EFO29270.1 N-acetyltransferase HPA3 [Roseibium sp. TrichSKD4]
MGQAAIRQIEAGDRAQWEALWQDYLAFYHTSVPANVTDTLFERLLSEEGHNGLVAVLDGKVVGFVHYLFHPSTWSSELKCYLEDLFVSDETRGTGAGRKLIEAVYAAADARPDASGNVYWHTNGDNARARQLYDHIGNLSTYVYYDRTKAPVKEAS